MSHYKAALTALLLTVTFSLAAGSRGQPPEEGEAPMTREERLEFLDDAIMYWEMDRMKQERRARYYDREAERLQFYDYGYARRNYNRADWYCKQAAKSAQKVEAYQKEKEQLLKNEGP